MPGPIIRIERHNFRLEWVLIIEKRLGQALALLCHGQTLIISHGGLGNREILWVALDAAVTPPASGDRPGRRSAVLRPASAMAREKPGRPRPRPGEHRSLAWRVT